MQGNFSNKSIYIYILLNYKREQDKASECPRNKT